MYFTQKILRFIGRLVLNLFLWPVKLGWRLLKRKRNEDDTDTDLSDPGDVETFDLDTEESETVQHESPDPAIEDTETAAPTETGANDPGSGHGTATTSDGATAANTDPAAGNGARARFRRVLVAAGVLSGLSSFVSPFLFGLPFGYLGGGGLVGSLLLGVGIPVTVAGGLAWGVGRRREWAWYGGMAWGALILVMYPLRGALPGVLLTPASGAWQVLGNLGAFVGLYEPLTALSAVGIGGAVLFTGYRAHPDGWTTATADDAVTEEAKELDVADEAALAEPTGGTDGPAAGAPGPTETDAGESAPTERDDHPSPTGEAAAATAATASGDDQPAGTASTSATETDNEETVTANATEDGTPESGESGEDTSEEAESDVGTAEPAPLAGYQDALAAADPATRQDAIEALADEAADAAVPEQAVIDALADRLENDDSAAVRVAACEALGRLGTDADRVRQLLKDHRLDPDGDVSRAASRALRTSDS